MCSGHPLLDATLDLVIERYRDLLKRGAVLIDDTDDGDQVRALVYLEHSIQDARTDRAGNRRVVSKRLQFVEVDQTGQPKNAGPAPYLDYRPPTEQEVSALEPLTNPTRQRGPDTTELAEQTSLARFEVAQFSFVVGNWYC